MAERLVILQDRHEQTPLVFSDAVDVELATLPTADYSVKGFTDRVVVERKALGDLWQCVGRERERFEAELARMRDWPLRCLVVEATIDRVLGTVPRGRVRPATVIHSTIAWGQDFGIPVIWAGHPRGAAAWVERFLTRVARKAAA